MAASSTKSLQAFLLWCRKEKVVVSSVTIAGITVTIERDCLLQPPASANAPAERKQGIIEQFAGVLAPQLRGDAPIATENEPTEEDE